MHVMVETEKWAAVAHQVRLQVRYCTGSACQQALEQHLGQMLWRAGQCNMDVATCYMESRAKRLTGKHNFNSIKAYIARCSHPGHARGVHRSANG